MRSVIIGLLLITISFAIKAQEFNIIPKPVSLTTQTGSFTISKSTPLIAKTKSDKNAAALFNTYLLSYYGYKLPVTTSGKGIVLSTNEGKVDGYSFECGNDGIKIVGQSPAGTFYGVQTLIQLLPIAKSVTLQVPAVSIKDQPELEYRGMHLDVGRHFFPVDFIKKYIDYIALHKMNYFHWHLTEDQGWRIAIKKYPKLTTVGGWRNGTIIGNFPGTGNDNKKYGGFYTQEEVKEIVAYAAQRYITVIPEIEMPGHASAAIAAYPYLSCFPGESTQMPKGTVWSGTTAGKQVQQTWGVFDDVFCAGKESTFKFLEDVLDEVLPLFPAKYVHVGGDECPKANWKRCPACQKRMVDNKLKDEHELQSYFIQRIEKYLNKKGKILIGWDEILEGGLAPNAVVMSWRGEKGGITAAKEKHKVIMTPNSYVYFDHQQAAQEDSVTITRNKSYLPIEKVYNWEIVPPSLNADEKKYILGGQANLWTEYVENTKKIEYMIFPRMSALSEALWTPKANRDYNDFKNRLTMQTKRYQLWGANYFGN